MKKTCAGCGSGLPATEEYIEFLTQTEHMKLHERALVCV